MGIIPHLPISDRRAFSLIELLVSMAVLSLVVVLLAQLMGGATDTIAMGRQRIDADNEARRLFDRMAADFASMLQRHDVDFRISKDLGNDSLFFFSEAPGFFSGNTTQQPVSLIGYRINDDHQLERFGKGLAWDAAPPDGPVFLTFTGNSTTPQAASTLAGPFLSLITGNGTDFHVLGENVFRLEFSFLLKPTTTAEAEFSDRPTRSSGASSPFSNTGSGLDEVQAILVTLAILDHRSRNLAGSGLDALAERFTDVSGSTTPATEWKAISLSSLGIPQAAAAQVRIYQRLFPLNSSLTP